jgi:hypothetical protein
MPMNIKMTFEIEVEYDGSCPVAVSSGIQSWIDDCEGVIDSRLINYERVPGDDDG